MLILLVGKSGTGKSYIAEQVCKDGEYKEVRSRTTRERRYEGESNHIFVSEKQALKEKDRALAYTFYNGNHYYVVERDLFEKDIYVIDPKGIEFFREKSEVDFKIVEIKCNVVLRFIRMIKRGNTIGEALKRISIDRKEFANIKAETIISNNQNNNKAIEKMREILKRY